VASIEKHSTKRGARYAVRYRLADGRQRWKTLPTKRDAERFAHRVEADKLRGVLPDLSLGKTTFNVWAHKWLDASERTKRATTVARDRCVVETRLLPELGPRPIAAISPEDVRTLVDFWATTFAPRSVHTYYGVLRAILNAAVNADLLGRSPCRGVRLPPPERRRAIRFLTELELRRLAAATPDPYRPMVYAAGVLGLRWSEVAGLRVGCLDLTRGTLEVAETIAEVNGYVLRADVKTASSRRTLPIPRFLAELLTEHLAARGLGDADTDALVFVAPDGGPLRAGNFRNRIWARATAASGLKGLTFHHLRHSAVGFLIDSGAHVAVIQKRMGHSSIRTTLDVYGHVLPDTDQTATDHLERLFGARTRRAVAADGALTPVIQLDQSGR
jgi:integrase